MTRIQYLKLKDKKEQYEILKHELKLVSEVAPFGAHNIVAEKVGISTKYSKQIRAYEGAKHPTYDNYTMVQRMVVEYRKINNKEIQKLSV